MKIIFLDRCKKLVISTLTRFAIENIEDSNMYIELRINTYCNRNYMVKINII